MKDRPLSITFLGLLYMLAGPLGLISIYRHDGLAALLSTDGAAYFYPAFCVGALLVGMSLLQVRPFGFFSFISYSWALIGYLGYNMFIGRTSLSYMNFSIGTLAIVSILLVLRKNLTVVFFNPSLRWWERSPRYSVQIASEFEIDGRKRTGQLMNLSRGGCFVQINATLHMDEVIQVKIKFLDYELNVTGKVIWSVPSLNGYGLMFTGLRSSDRKQIDQILKYIVDAMGKKNVQINKNNPAA